MSKEKDLRIMKGLYAVIRKHGEVAMTKSEVAMTEKIPMVYVQSFVDWAYEDGKKDGLRDGRASVIREILEYVEKNDVVCSNEKCPTCVPFLKFLKNKMKGVGGV